MQATSTVESTSASSTASSAPPASDSRTWSRAFADIREGSRSRELWSYLGWQDIKQKYRRSVLGPLWITISQGVTSLGLGILYAALLGMKVETFLPYITAGFILWHFIMGCITEGAETFISNEGVMKHLPAPLMVYVLRTVWRQCLMFAHTLIIYVIVLAVFFGTLNYPYFMPQEMGPTTPMHPGINPQIFLAVPAFALLVVNSTWVVMLFGIISTRFRDIPQVINSVVQLIFYMTPIIWSPDMLGEKGARLGHAAVQFNPLYHFVNLVRSPLLGQTIEWQNWVVVGGFTIVGWCLALVTMRNYRARVSYWV